MHGKKCPVTMLAMILMVIGGINWGLVGVGGFAGGNWNVVNLLLGQWPSVEWVVYILVGLSSIWSLVGMCKCCGSDSCESK